MRKIFTGISLLTLDEKNRLFLPQKFRGKSKKYVLTCGVEPCVIIYPYFEWEEVVRKIDSFSLKNKTYQRIFIRTFFAEAEVVEIDPQGRILIPQKFIKKYGFSSEVILVGNRNKIELWDKTSWEKYLQEAEKIIKKIKTQIEL
ncbi:MAG: division/cell wall cluster transcriptional repressor MraZ [Endomicrobia bacterium]|nr:division/cell wall cluster transcriptional repressor MraZ [Endomicrobiia bacterium]